MYKIQSVFINTNDYSIHDGIKWLVENNLDVSNFSIKDKFYHFIQFDGLQLKREGYIFKLYMMTPNIGLILAFNRRVQVNQISRN